jgi:hypothetical protein
MVTAVGGPAIANRYSGGAWAGFLTIGGFLGAGPSCTSYNSGGRVLCVANGGNSGIYVSAFKGGAWGIGNWTGWGSLGGSSSSNANCTATAPNQFVCAAVATDNALWTDVYNGTSWLGWVKQGGTELSVPGCAPLGTGQATCMVVGVDNKLLAVVGP